MTPLTSNSQKFLNVVSLTSSALARWSACLLSLPFAILRHSAEEDRQCNFGFHYLKVLLSFRLFPHVSLSWDPEL